MTEPEAQAIVDKMHTELPAGTKAVLIVKIEGRFVFRYCGMGAGETADVLTDMRAKLKELL